MATWYAEDFETRSLGPLEGQDNPAWVKVGGNNSMTVVNTSPITGTKSAKQALSNGSLVYIKNIDKRKDYTVQWKWRMNNIVPSGFVNNPSPIHQMSLRLVEAFITTAWGCTLIPKQNRLNFIHGTSTPGMLKVTNIPLTTFTSVHTFEVTVTPDRTLTFTIDGTPVLNTFATTAEASQIYTGGVAVAGGSMDVYLDDFNFTYVPPTPPSPPKAPGNPFSIRRKNYTVISWDRVTKNEDNSDLSDVTQYDVYGAKFINESDQSLIGTINVTDATGKIATAFVDVNQNSSHAYRVKAVVTSGILESELSDRAVAIQISSQVDTKEEFIDRILFTLDQSQLDTDVLV